MSAPERGLDDRRRPRRLLLLLVALLVTAGWAAGIRDFGSQAYFLPFAGWLLFALSLVPAIEYLLRTAKGGARVEPIPFLPIVGLAYGVYYALPVLWSDRVVFMRAEPPPADLSAAMRLALFGWCSLLVAFYVSGRALGTRGRTADAAGTVGLERWSPERVRGLAMPLVVLGIGAYGVDELFEVPEGLAQLVFLAQLAFQIGLGLLLMLSLRGRLSGPWKLFSWGVLLPLLFAFQLGGGAIATIVYAGLFVLMLLWGVGRRVPWAVVLPGLLLLVLVKGAIAEFRQLAWNTSAGQAMTPAERTQLMGDLALGRVRDEGLAQSVASAAEVLQSRTSLLGLLAHTSERTPAFVPYQRGWTYGTLPAAFVPRALWPDKPKKELGQWFGHTYGLLDPADETTAVNLPQLVELYINFGTLGVVLGMAAFGVLFQVFYRRLNYAGASDTTVLVAALFFSRMINLESDCSVVYGTVLQLAVLLWLIGKRARA